MKVKIKLPSASKLIQEKGLGNDGAVQMYHTENVMRRMQKYMPYRSGASIKLMIVQTDIRSKEIVLDAPYVRYIFLGKKMVNAITGKGPAMIPGVGPRYKKGTILKVTDSPLEYTKTKNPQAGPRWDKAVAANEGKALVADLQNFIDRRSK